MYSPIALMIPPGFSGDKARIGHGDLFLRRTVSHRMTNNDNANNRTAPGYVTFVLRLTVVHPKFYEDI